MPPKPPLETEESPASLPEIRLPAFLRTITASNIGETRSRAPSPRIPRMNSTERIYQIDTLLKSHRFVPLDKFLGELERS